MRDSGFTLIELLIAVAVIGVLVAIAIPQYRTFTIKSERAGAFTLLKAGHTAEISYYAFADEFIPGGCLVSGCVLMGSDALNAVKRLGLKGMIEQSDYEDLQVVSKGPGGCADGSILTSCGYGIIFFKDVDNKTPDPAPFDRDQYKVRYNASAALPGPNDGTPHLFTDDLTNTIISP